MYIEGDEELIDVTSLRETTVWWHFVFVSSSNRRLWRLSIRQKTTRFEVWIWNVIIEIEHEEQEWLQILHLSTSKHSNCNTCRQQMSSPTPCLAKTSLYFEERKRETQSFFLSMRRSLYARIDKSWCLDSCNEHFSLVGRNSLVQFNFSSHRERKHIFFVILSLYILPLKSFGTIFRQPFARRWYQGRRRSQKLWVHVIYLTTWKTTPTKKLHVILFYTVIVTKRVLRRFGESVSFRLLLIFHWNPSLLWCRYLSWQ